MKFVDVFMEAAESNPELNPTSQYQIHFKTFSGSSIRSKQRGARNNTLQPRRWRTFGQTIWATPTVKRMDAIRCSEGISFSDSYWELLRRRKIYRLHLNNWATHNNPRTNWKLAAEHPCTILLLHRNQHLKPHWLETRRYKPCFFIETR